MDSPMADHSGNDHRPSPEFRTYCDVDTKFADRFGVGGSAAKCFATCFHRLHFQEPVARAVGVGHGFTRGEGFRRHRGDFGFTFPALQRCGTISVRDRSHISPDDFYTDAALRSTMNGPGRNRRPPMFTTSVMMALPV